MTGGLSSLSSSRTAQCSQRPCGCFSRAASLLFSAKNRACCGCSVVNALATPTLRYHFFAGQPLRHLADDTSPCTGEAWALAIKHGIDTKAKAPCVRGAGKPKVCLRGCRYYGGRRFCGGDGDGGRETVLRGKGNFWKSSRLPRRPHPFKTF